MNLSKRRSLQVSSVNELMWGIHPTTASPAQYPPCAADAAPTFGPLPSAKALRRGGAPVPTPASAPPPSSQLSSLVAGPRPDYEDVGVVPPSALLGYDQIVQRLRAHQRKGSDVASSGDAAVVAAAAAAVSVLPGRAQLSALSRSGGALSTLAHSSARSYAPDADNIGSTYTTGNCVANMFAAAPYTLHTGAAHAASSTSAHAHGTGSGEGRSYASHAAPSFRRAPPPPDRK